MSMTPRKTPHGIQSMTGYGRATKRTDLGTVTMELRSTNHRYLEVEQRLPNGLTALQGRLAELIRAHVHRGRVEALVVMQSRSWDQRRVMFDEPLLQRYHDALLEMKARFGLKGAVTLEHLLALPQAVTVTEERLPTERLWGPIRLAAEAAVRELVRVRLREGGVLVQDVRRQIQLIDRHVRLIQRRLPVAFAHQRRQLRERLQHLLGKTATVSAAQLGEAAALVRDTDIHEELVRIGSHLTHMRETLARGELVGKQLDFIGQELMRETNTMGAKVNDSQAARHVVDIKGCIERIREQVQNLE